MACLRREEKYNEQRLRLLELGVVACLRREKKYNDGRFDNHIVRVVASLRREHYFRDYYAQNVLVFMKRKLAKQLDSALETLYKLRVHGIKPSEEAIASYQEVFTILYDDGLSKPGPNGDEITAKGVAFIKKGGYIALWNKEWLNYGISFLIGACSGIVACLVSLCLK